MVQHIREEILRHTPPLPQRDTALLADDTVAAAAATWGISPALPVYDTLVYTYDYAIAERCHCWGVLIRRHCRLVALRLRYYSCYDMRYAARYHTPHCLHRC